MNIQRRKVNKVALRRKSEANEETKKRQKGIPEELPKKRRIEQSGHNSHDKNDDEKEKKRFGEKRRKMKCERGIKEIEKQREEGCLKVIAWGL